MAEECLSQPHDPHSQHHLVDEELEELEEVFLTHDVPVPKEDDSRPDRQAYCSACRASQPVKDWEIRRTKKGRSMLKGSCRVCGKTVVGFVKCA